MPAARIFKLATVYTEDEIASVRYEQTADVMLFSHLDHPIQRLRRFAHNDWRMDDMPVGSQVAIPTGVAVVATNPQSSDPDYVGQVYAYAVTAVSDGRESQASVTLTVTNDLALKGDYNDVLVTPVAGIDEYRVYSVRSGVYGYVGSIIPPETIFKDDNISADFSSGPPRNTNPFESGENPAAVTFHDARSVFARTPHAPNAVHTSRTDDILNFDKSRPAQATDAISVGLRGRRVNAVQHLLSLGDLLAFTNDGLFALVPTTDNVLSPTSIQSKAQGYSGAGICRPEIVDDVAFYTPGGNDAIRTLGYTLDRDGYRGNDVTVFARHFFARYKITHMAWCKKPSSMLVCRRSDGKLIVLTWQAEQDVWGWTPWDTDGEVESICPVSEDGNDVLYAIVRRTVGGVLKRNMERLTYPHWMDQDWSEPEKAVIMDSAVIYEGEPASNFSRLFHLEGRDVAVLADGYVIPDRSVVNGVLTPPLDFEASRVAIGLPYEAFLKTLPVVVQGQQGTTKGRPSAATSVIVEAMNTAGIEYGIGTAIGEIFDMPAPFEVVSTQDGPIPLFTGLYDSLGMPPGKWQEAQVLIRQRRPLPMCILGIMPDIEVS